MPCKFPYVKGVMASQKFEITSRQTASLRMIVESHGWVSLEPWSWDAEREVLSRTDLLEFPTTIRVTQSGPKVIEVNVEGKGSPEPGTVEAIVARWLSLDWDPSDAIEAASQVDPNVADMIGAGGGRFLRGSTFYEDYLKTVCTVQINWAGTKRMASRLVHEIGEGFVPTPIQIMDAGETALRERASMGFRAKGIMVSTEKLLEDGLVNETGAAEEDALTYDVLIALHGIGPYAASHLRVLLNDFSRVPVDSEVTSYFRERYGIGPNGVEGYLERWGEYKFLGYRLSRRLENR